MASLAINDEEAIALGQSIVTSAETINGYLNKISTINTQIATSWKGTDATAYCDRIAEQVNELTKAKEIINETGVYLQNVANAYREVRESNSNYTS